MAGGIQRCLSAREQGFKSVSRLNGGLPNANRQRTPFSPPLDRIVGEHAAEVFANGRERIFAAAVQNNQELILGPASREICVPQRAFESAGGQTQQ